MVEPAQAILAEPAGADEEQPGPIPPPPPPPRPYIPYPYPPQEPFAPAGTAAAPQDPFGLRLRVLQALAGIALLTVFFLPWNGARSWEILPSLRGLDFVRQIGFLVAGSVLLSMGVLPVPPLFRAALGAGVAVAALGSGGAMLSPLQGLLALLVIALLPAALLVRTQLQKARIPRWLGFLALATLILLYLLPRERVTPLRVAVDLIYYQHDEMARFIGTYLLLPLPLLGLATVALIGTDVAVIGELLCWLLLCWGPGALLVLAIDKTQAYMAAAVLAYACCASYSVAALLYRLVASREGLGEEFLD